MGHTSVGHSTEQCSSICHFPCGFLPLLKHRCSFGGASAYAWAAEGKIFKQIEFLGFPRVVWSTPGCRIEIRDQIKLWLSVINKEAVMGNACPAARGCWQDVTTLDLG